MKLSIGSLFKSKTVWGVILYKVAGLLGGGHLNVQDILSAVGAIVGTAGARSAVAELIPTPAIARWFDGLGANDILRGAVQVGGINQDVVRDPLKSSSSTEYGDWLRQAHPAVAMKIASPAGNMAAGVWIGQFIRANNLGDGTGVLSTSKFWVDFDSWCSLN